MFDGNFFFNAGSDSVSLAPDTWATPLLFERFGGFLLRFRFRSPLLSSLDELTFLDLDFDDFVLMARGRGSPLLLLLSFEVRVPSDESVLEELERLDSTRWLDSMGERGVPACCKNRSN